MSSGRLQNNGTSLNIRRKKWSRSFKGGGRLLEVPTVTLTGKILVFWMGGRLWDWSLREVVTHGGVI